ncbi:GNAT family N-acetyltransferase [Gelidibacter salicanalis]|uniref:GNAT family N-acetyltransferase n=1 Tax=Gelidibacter salicanalis TaxID=291193 RepID=A0A5C7AH50_9FLAO|nr:GNAT family N-acetyltransferase [Gelidibacter salicanalis]TXE07657.1 GNAT family N-acetyltransferase [Gelidibacter salicanalis]
MSKAPILIREIKTEDDAQVAAVIRDVLVEMGAPKVGTAYADEALDIMTATYAQNDRAYFVVDDGGKIIGGAGIAPLENFEDAICELQKMYFLPEARGKGLGAKMMAICLEKAKSLGYDKCYLETLPYMTDATKLYATSGFQNLDGPLGNTGHYACNVWMIKTL